MLAQGEHGPWAGKSWVLAETRLGDTGWGRAQSLLARSGEQQGPQRVLGALLPRRRGAQQGGGCRPRLVPGRGLCHPPGL